MTVLPLPARAEPPRAPDLGLAAAGVLTAGMALYHFGLPFLWGWGKALTPWPMLHWALFMLNASFSYLLLAGGAATVALAFRRDARDRTGRWVLFAIGGYWVFNLLYQLVSPMPMPPRLAALRWGLFGFAAAMAWLYGAAVVRGAGRAQAPPRSVPVLGRPG